MNNCKFGCACRLIFWPCCGFWDISSLTRDWTWAPAVKAPDPNHQTTKELLVLYSIELKSVKSFEPNVYSLIAPFFARKMTEVSNSLKAKDTTESKVNMHSVSNCWHITPVFHILFSHCSFPNIGSTLFLIWESSD